MKEINLLDRKENFFAYNFNRSRSLLLDSTCLMIVLLVFMRIKQARTQIIKIHCRQTFVIMHFFDRARNVSKLKGLGFICDHFF